MTMKKNQLFLLSGLIFAVLLGVLIITVFCNDNDQGVPGEDTLINSSNEPEADPRIDKTRTACKDYYNPTILKEYGNWSKRTYYDRDDWKSLRPQDIDFDKYWAPEGPITGGGPDSCIGGIFLWWDPDIPVNETVMDEIYSRFCDRAKETGMEEPYLKFIPGKLIPD
jgi:hypothetical protein